jgi:hypothetical protein
MHWTVVKAGMEMLYYYTLSPAVLMPLQHATCPLCRKDLLKKKANIVVEDDEEPWDDTFG